MIGIGVPLMKASATTGAITQNGSSENDVSA